MTINCVIIDDEPLAVDLIKGYVELSREKLSLLVFQENLSKFNRHLSESHVLRLASGAGKAEEAVSL